MHEDAAERMMTVAPFLVLAAGHILRKADEFGASTLVAKLRRILQQEHRAGGRVEACTRRVEMPAQNVAFAYPPVGEEPIGRLGIGPILASKRNALSDPASHPGQKLSKPLPKAHVFEGALVNFLIDPMGRVGRSDGCCRSRW